MIQRIINRFKRACHTNDAQINAALLLSGLNAVACAYVDAPLFVFIAAILFWPALAFVFNLIDPIPKN